MLQTMIVKANGEKIPTTPKNGTDFKLEELQKIVGGYIEIVRCDNPEWILVVNEEGKLQDHYLNKNATALVMKQFGGQDYIAGDVLLCKSEQVK